MRLITGDRVTVSDTPNGKKTASVQRAPGRENVFFQIAEKDGALTVLPSDAAMLVRTGRLDEGLFDIEDLVAQGYDEAHADALPLIVSTPKGSARAAARKVDTLAAFHDDSTRPRQLPSIGAQALRVDDQDLPEFWKQLVPAADASLASAAAVTPKIWLDHKVRPTLDRSTAQINAPTAWAAGHHGEGVKVAVLDTGADQTHPDLAGRVSQAKDFSGSGSTQDHFGHGTHVAATAAGSGAASGGLRKGVAPSADLLIGKVLGDNGFGSESQVIEGMEWAVAQGARVVNMSLGADMETDGTDPLSLAVNGMSRSSDALFVVAAGNAGELGEMTVGSPGAADAALTVGAVDRDDSLAYFSSRGPRLGDKAAKPDITAPGVGIVAARAAGTTMGVPVDDYYVSAGGTSMATPHVAGAAALLAGQHPDWTGEQLKDALISTSRTVSGQVPTEQGGGRVDVKAAFTSPITATGTIVLGPFETDGSPVEHAGTVRYTNFSDREVSLSLQTALKAKGGRELPTMALTLGADTVRVAPGATVEVPVGVNPAKADRGSYYGYVTATSADGVSVHTTVSLWVHAPMHKVTTDSYGRDGEPTAWALLDVFGGDTEVRFTDWGVAEVEEGTYQIAGTLLEGGGPTGVRMVQVINPEVKVTTDTTVTLDARETKLVRVHTPKPAERRNNLTYQMYRKIDGVEQTAGIFYNEGGGAVDLYVNPTSKVTEGAFEFSSRWEMTAPQVRTEVRGADFDLEPFYVKQSTPFDPRGEQLVAVDAGTSDKPDLRPGIVRGKLAVIRDSTASAEYELAKAAAKAGAKGIAIVLPEGYIAWTRWKPMNTRSAVPAIRMTAADGAKLLNHMRKHTAVVKVSGTVESPYLYDITANWQHYIPKDVTYTVSDRNTAQVKTSYAHNGALHWTAEQRFSWRPYARIAFETSRWAPTGKSRTEYVTSGDTQWMHTVDFMTGPEQYFGGPLLSGIWDSPRTFKTGEKATEDWYKAVVRPSIPRGWSRPAVRDGDTLSLSIPEYTDAATGHWGRKQLPPTEGGIGARTGSAGTVDDPSYLQGDTVAAVLYRNGKKVSDAADAWRTFSVPAGAADYRLDLTTERETEYWQNGTRTSTSWTFRSNTAAKETLLPLLQVDYDVPADLSNTVRSRGRHDIDLAVRHQDGLAAPAGVKLKVEASFDDGRSWMGQVRIRDRSHNRYTATIEQPGNQRQGGYVTLRVTATDKAGNSVRQTVERAYLLGR
ncbi:S8 family serine peptidase [Streptomyces sp. NBC_01637]|uniref:S8 family serine peptidase n=1 Tax=unclassified Streptomyces TaxID=2593676 RepID=UPI00387027F4|nr:S8 family serine peptidase [Streptomyces sp. NBC_01653]WTC84600.1 S8 family serine peptidase [Streptomyces sp. NBC_01653]WTD86267.1 S8 family serine peptidase [Streptomyces sp. NBC_01637]WTD94257.1 S8 family serine peptidase [Streptomyces sp. NBC_01637]